MSKEEKLYQAIGEIGDDLVAEAKAPGEEQDTVKGDASEKSGRHHPVKWMLPMAAGLAVVMGTAAVLQSGNFKDKEGETEDKNIYWIDNSKDVQVNHDINSTQNNAALEAHVVAKTEYPVMAPYPDTWPAESEEKAWKNSVATQNSSFYRTAINLDQFILTSMEEMLTDADGKNVVYSPLNVYLALGMLAEITDGGSRQQILELVEAESVESLRKQANAIWNAHYRNDGVTTSLLASSLWLSQGIAYKEEPLKVMADNYHASTYQGQMGTAEYNGVFKAWLNANTGGMLTDQTETLELDADTILSLASTVFYAVHWEDEFKKDNTKQQSFFGIDDQGKKAEYVCDFMNQESRMFYYWGEGFSAVKSDFSAEGSMYFILPDEGVAMDTLLEGEAFQDFVNTTDEWKNQKMMDVNLSVPKFDVSSQIDLKEHLQNLGVTDVFEQGKADFSPILDNSAGVAVTEAKHGARVCIDEEGCVAAAYVFVKAAIGMIPKAEEIDFVLDRPFIFVIESGVGMPLFIGVVNQPQ